MMDNTENITIKKDTHSKDDLDFHFLREEGLSYIESFGRNLWTDYNTHDPGVTILEVLCYAITDLGNRISLPLENILADPDQLTWKKQFHQPKEIFPCRAITALDYRKLFVDIQGVRNCWLQSYNKTVYVDCKHLQMSYHPEIWEGLEERHKKSFIMGGLLRVLVDLDGQVPLQKVKKQIFQSYHQHRNLCEDLIDVEEIPVHPIKVCAVLDIDPNAEEELIVAKIEMAIDQYFSPSVRFYNFSQMVAKGYTTEQIFDGPMLQHGFLDPGEIEKSSLRKEVRLSDIINLIMDVEGVNLIKDIHMDNCDGKEEGESWVICIDPGKKPERCEKSKFNCYKGLLPVNITAEKVEKYREELERSYFEARLDSGAEVSNNPVNKDFELSSFSSIRNDFPEVYGIGKTGLSATVSDKRKSQAKQLKAYLTFFDQILASYFRHLDQVKDLLAIDGINKQTYFTQAITDIGDQLEFLGDWYETTDLDQLLLKNFDEYNKRKQQLLDHLIARFAEKFSDYVFVMKKLYGDSTDTHVLAAKANFLKEYGVTSSERNTGFNYYRQHFSSLWDTSNVSGIEKRVALLAGFKNYYRRHLSRSFVEVYSFLNSAGKLVYRWRIYDNNRSILLSATENYNTPSEAYEEIYMVIQQVIVIEKEVIEDHFEKTEELGYETEDAGCFRITKSPKGRYSFSIINPAIENPRDPRRIIASQYRYYSPQNIKKAILSFKQFIKESFIEEGIFLVENILLRPSFEEGPGESTFMPFCKDDCEDGALLDPYSFRVTIVIPGNTFRFSDRIFRDYLENLIREELPSHVLAKICWVGNSNQGIPDQTNPLVQFEDKYKDFLSGLSKGNYQHHAAFIEVLTALRSIYPTGSLYNCEEEDESTGLRDKIILGRTNLGTL